MRIVDRTTFLAMPAGTVFIKFPPQPGDGCLDLGADGPILIKEETVGEDFVVQSTIPSFEGVDRSEDEIAVYADMLKGKGSPAVDYDFAGRDGYFDKDQLFLVWDRKDLHALIGRLNQALEALRVPD